ncbi:hypothetical protein Asppvi_001971 [Aspergillus pseudoviridinutans]|uniref:Clr5 domain-containing protein n=1 Tax=Aspergillus pseudoviridinutans TaxID=1517512 RepID=A0A9P3F160_9EURO|nr:uncharacterized protein Asppvi_001971 [Aspergillus pseudoviridinutans]GIJ92693.1 hypothetical protein Asppvi_001971 [Aspergillus pseudoviridinutans]
MSSALHPTETEWEAYREVLQKLWMQLPMKQVIKEMESKYQFSASYDPEKGVAWWETQYQRQFRKWGFRKNLSDQEWKIVNYKVKAREQHGRSSILCFGETLISDAKMRKEIARHAPTAYEAALWRIGPAPQTPEEISIRTPASEIHPGTPCQNQNELITQDPAELSEKIAELQQLISLHRADGGHERANELCGDLMQILDDAERLRPDKVIFIVFEDAEPVDTHTVLSRFEELLRRSPIHHDIGYIPTLDISVGYISFLFTVATAEMKEPRDMAMVLLSLTKARSLLDDIVGEYFAEDVKQTVLPPLIDSFRKPPVPSKEDILPLDALMDQIVSTCMKEPLLATVIFYTTEHSDLWRDYTVRKDLDDMEKEGLLASRVNADGERMYRLTELGKSARRQLLHADEG